MIVARIRVIQLVLAGTMLIGVALYVGGCNTVEGVGHDLAAAGEGLANSAADMNPNKQRSATDW